MKTNVLGRYWLVLVVLLVGCSQQEGELLPGTASLEPESRREVRYPTRSPTKTVEETEIVKLFTITPAATATTFPTATEMPPVEPSPTIRSGETRIAKVDARVMVYVPEGEFRMGSNPEDSGMDLDETPQHPVYLSAFWMDQTEVTNAAFVLFLNASGNQIEGGSPWLHSEEGKASIWKGKDGWQVQNGKEQNPVGGVTWYGARAYCTWASKRLPSEAEWEKAARGTDGRTYPWGNKINCTMALYNDCGKYQVAKVDQYLEGGSPYGILGMAGSMWEWVADRYSNEYYAHSPKENPSGPTEGDYFVLRGGSYLYDWKHVRSANRRHNAPYNSKADYGFRCAQGVE